MEGGEPNQAHKKAGEERQTPPQFLSFERGVDVTNLRISRERDPGYEVRHPNHEGEAVARIKYQANHHETEPEPWSRHHRATTAVHLQPVPPDDESTESRREKQTAKDRHVRTPDCFPFRR